jgi:hypothetical protein
MKPLMILVAGPYRSGTNDQPELIEKNVKAMSDTALTIYKMGHLPVLGEWFALPLIETAGSKVIGDSIWKELFHPVAIRLIGKCDVVLRIGGQSNGADEMVKIGREQGKRIIFNLKDL